MFKNDGKQMYVNIFKGRLIVLKSLATKNGIFDVKLAINLVVQSINKGWKSFYPINDNDAYKSNQYKDNMEHFERDMNYNLTNKEF